MKRRPAPPPPRAIVGLAAASYLAIAMAAYAFRHPDLTQTQVLFAIGEALLWR